MAYSDPRIPTVNIITVDPITNLVVEGEVTGVPPTGATYAGIFALSCELLRQDVTGIYEMTGSVAIPAWTAVGGGGGFTGTPTQGVYLDAVGNPTGDAGFTRIAATKYTNILTPIITPGNPVHTVGVGLSDLYVQGGIFTNLTVGQTLTISIASTGPVDTFDWSFSGGGSGAGVSITGSQQNLVTTPVTGLAIVFGSINGHTMGDTWVITVTSLETGLLTGTPLGQITGGGVQSIDAVNQIALLDIFGNIEKGPYGQVLGVFNYGTGEQATTSSGYDGRIYTSKIGVQGGGWKHLLTFDSSAGMSYSWASGSYTFPVGNAVGELTNDGAGVLTWTSSEKVFEAHVDLTNAQVLALNGSPIPIVTAIGAGLTSKQAIIPISATMAYTYGSVQYGTNTELDLIHTGSTEPMMKTSIAASASTFIQFAQNIPMVPSGNQFIANADLNVFVPTGNPTGGDPASNIRVTVLYKVMTVLV